MRYRYLFELIIHNSSTYTCLRSFFYAKSVDIISVIVSNPVRREYYNKGFAIYNVNTITRQGQCSQPVHRFPCIFIQNECRFNSQRFPRTYTTSTRKKSIRHSSNDIYWVPKIYIQTFYSISWTLIIKHYYWQLKNEILKSIFSKLFQFGPLLKLFSCKFSKHSLFVAFQITLQLWVERSKNKSSWRSSCYLEEMVSLYGS